MSDTATADLAHPRHRVDSQRSLLRWIRRGAWVLVAVVLLCAPVVGSRYALDSMTGTTLAAYVPTQGDEVFLWHQIATFREVGFDGGNYTYQERLPAAGTPFGAWGPAVPALYGTIARVTGWDFRTPPLVNLALLTFGIAAFLAIARPPFLHLLAFSAAVVTFGPLYLYVVSGMQESLHMTLALIIGALAGRAFADDAPRARRWWLACVGVIIVASLLRPTWALLLPAIALAMLPWRRRALALFTLAGMTAGLLALFAWWAAPFPYGGASYLVQQPGALGEKLSILGENAGRNLELLFLLRHPVFLLNGATNLQLALGLLAGVAMAVIGWRSRSRALRAGGVFLSLALTLPTLFIIVGYDMENGTRVLASLVLVCVATLCAGTSRLPLVIPAVIALLSVVSISWFTHDFKLRTNVNYQPVTANMASMSEAVSMIDHRDDVGPRCNDLLASTQYGVARELLMVPAGIGLSMDFDHDFAGPIKSGYVLIDDLGAAAIGDRLELGEEIGRTPIGRIYENDAAAC